ncbi:uncharacterized protein N7496_005578 [Penicillium cataractarum]|uniref:HNH nuclease domain-containing protein n=1 Tax=Penicillium cataractarum TaxID=2100454 RepID=A0A9W9SJ06_9EURO|nr:uncharacterized protein N7496_005578 [Penicillium cataractarum]KAJ5378169.1 hypothetical protein N7496_005578 [Penicillium cataractarum]
MPPSSPSSASPPSFLPLTEAHLALFSPAHKKRIKVKEARRESLESDMCNLSHRSTLSDFLSKKTGSLIARIEELEANRDGIRSAPDALTDPIFSDVFRDIIRVLAKKRIELDILHNTGRYIEQQIGEQLESDCPRSRLPPDSGPHLDERLRIDEYMTFDEGLDASHCDGKNPLKRPRLQDDLSLHDSDYDLHDVPIDPSMAKPHTNPDAEDATDDRKPRWWDEDKISQLYTDMMISRVVEGSAKQKRAFKSHDQQRFSNAVLERYDALEKTENSTRKWCHVTGRWWHEKFVKCAHLVPKCMTGPEIAMLFGDGELVLKDPLNGISLHNTVELAYDSARIFIVPNQIQMPERMDTEWKCLLVDPATDGNQVACDDGRERTYWRLEFRTNNRPARRYLCFRFLITYIYAKQKGFKQFTDKVECRSTFWGSPGEYLEQSSLELLTRNVGATLPRTIERNVFDGHASDVEVRRQDELAPVAAMRIFDAGDEGEERWEKELGPHSDASDDEMEDSDNGSEED